MRGRLLTTLLAVLTTIVLGTGTAPAVTAMAGWHITPGGTFGGSGGQVRGPSFTCGSSQITGQFNAFGDQLGAIRDIRYQSCTGGLLTVAISVQLPWTLTGVEHMDGVTTVNITGIAGTVSGPGCNYRVAGQAAATYVNTTGILSVTRDYSVVSYVDPASNCFGQVVQGQAATLLSSSYSISPRQVIVPA
jgi:hypothetical protein